MLEKACNPALHYTKACVLYRLSHPDTDDLPGIHPNLSKWLEPPQHIKNQCQKSLSVLKELVDVKPGKPKVVLICTFLDGIEKLTMMMVLFVVAKRVKKSKKMNRLKDDQIEKDDEVIDLDAILG